MRLVPMIIEIRQTHRITRFFSILSGIILWASFMYLFEIIIINLVNIIVEIPYSIRVLLIILVPLLALVGYFNATHNYIKNYQVNLKEKSNSKSQPVTIIHISDLHIGSMHNESMIKQVVQNINNIAKQKREDNKKVITIISGDIIDGSTPIDKYTFKEFKKASMPVYFTPGNHDYYQPIDQVKEVLKLNKITVLDNDNKILNDVNLNIIGYRYSFSKENIEEYELPIKEDMNNILIYHVPLLWDQFSSLGIELQLSGHTHGGQFYPVNWVLDRMYQYNKGLFNRKVEVKGKELTSYLSITNGIGTFATPIRLGTHSEITVLNLYRES